MQNMRAHKGFWWLGENEGGGAMVRVAPTGYTIGVFAIIRACYPKIYAGSILINTDNIKYHHDYFDACRNKLKRDTEAIWFGAISCPTNKMVVDQALDGVWMVTNKLLRPAHCRQASSNSRQFCR